MENPHNYEYEIDGKVSYVYLHKKNGRIYKIIIDTYNLEKVLNYKYKWHIAIQKRNPEVVNYVGATVYLGMVDGKFKSKQLLLHHFLIGNELENVDHKNNNQLDNRSENLRHTIQPDNDKNRRSKNRNNTSGYRNVLLVHKYYRVRIQINGKSHMFPEKFTDVHEAGKFAKQMREKYYGEFAGGE